MDTRDGFDERLRKARERQGLDRGTSRQGALPGAAAIGFRAGVEVVSALIVGVGIGWLLDRWLGTFPWLFLVFFLIGGAAGVLNVYRLFNPRTRPGAPPDAGAEAGSKDGSRTGGGRGQDD
ncbi:MAG: AtpZ/AtpI family protein [Acetobacteraceae bacterium]|nr:AtpZ/AtpI family protein [Acetobacteraceae bacterium]MCX7684907.1 AtpZ/AtpI family protein [Acetobacteraceae bacterium]MDW8398081.1 AtpZ/AtpI family protein [Acetobacteraceae bacterium]